MKTTITTLLLIFTFCVTAISQSEIGLLGGINNSSFYNFSSKFDHKHNYKSFNNYTVSVFYKKR
ncbi:hypothetical protein LJC11_04805 [Bacteroidales bacterium OttesenSCG-928-I21]|nr:hypothetical protein [Bacteroidales bacterium OttesenSCG-928-I21]